MKLEVRKRLEKSQLALYKDGVYMPLVQALREMEYLYSTVDKLTELLLTLDGIPISTMHDAADIREVLGMRHIIE